MQENNHRFCKHCGLKVKVCLGTGWKHDTGNRDIMTSCMLPSKGNDGTPRAEPWDEGCLVVTDEREGLR